MAGHSTTTPQASVVSEALSPESSSLVGGATSDELITIAVNGTLMKGLKLNQNMMKAGAVFYEDARTAAEYRIWAIKDDEHPAMMRVAEGGVHVELELWKIPYAGLVRILMGEPPGLCVGKVRLENGEEVLGVLGEKFLVDSHGQEITHHGGWRKYIASKEVIKQ